MVEYYNEKANISGAFPLGSFNSAFSFTGSQHIDAAATKSLSVDGFYLPLAKLQLMNSPLLLQENVKQAVPNCWDPSSLARYGFPLLKENIGIIVSFLNCKLFLTASLKILERML